MNRLLFILIFMSGLSFASCSKSNNEDEPKPTDPNCILTYTTTDNAQLPLTNPVSMFGANIIDHQYSKGSGKITFDRPITKIGADAFKDNSTIKSMLLPESVTEIGDHAFYFSSLESINFPKHLTKIGQYAFAVTKLKNVKIESQHIEFGLEAFNGNSSLTKVDLGNVTSVEWSNGAFHNCSALNEVILGNFKTLGSPTYDPLTTSLYGGPFFQCTSLKHITLPKTLETIGIGTFTQSGLTDIVLPENLKEICMGAFSTCSDLDCDITIPQSVDRIDLNAFGSCNKLSGHTLDLGSVKHIGPYAFTSVVGDGVYQAIPFGKIILPDTPPTFDTSEPHPFGNVASEMPKTYYVHSQSSAALYRNSPWNTGNVEFKVLN